MAYIVVKSSIILILNFKNIELSLPHQILLHKLYYYYYKLFPSSLIYYLYYYLHILINIIVNHCIHFFFFFTLNCLNNRSF